MGNSHRSILQQSQREKEETNNAKGDSIETFRPKLFQRYLLKCLTSKMLKLLWNCFLFHKSLIHISTANLYLNIIPLKDHIFGIQSSTHSMNLYDPSYKYYQNNCLTILITNCRLLAMNSKSQLVCIIEE